MGERTCRIVATKIERKDIPLNSSEIIGLYANGKQTYHVEESGELLKYPGFRTAIGEAMKELILYASMPHDSLELTLTLRD